jgi:hypothetical protein
VARYYDESLCINGESEADWYLSRARAVEERGRYALKEGSGVLLVEKAHTGNALDQTIRTTFRIARTDAEGNVVETGESTWTARYLFRYEAVHLLHRCGFEVEALVGDYRNGPVTEGSQLIFQVRHENARASGC